jgi:type I restriction enzyme R subunit
VIEPAMLFESPFSDIDTSGIMGVFDESFSAKILKLMERLNKTAEAA